MVFPNDDRTVLKNSFIENGVDPPVTHSEKKRGNDSFSWFAHSYMACLIQWASKLNFTKDKDVSVAVRRYGERKPEESSVHLSFG